MKSRNSNTNSLSWDSPILSLAGNRKPSATLQKLSDSGVNTLQDLLWIFPLRVQSAPKLQSFDQLNIDELFLGQAKVISIKAVPAFGRRGKGRVQLFNVTCVVKDLMSDNYLNLKWFNAYPNIRKQLEQSEQFTFLGEVTDYKGTIQIVNPKINPKEVKTENGLLVEYPTVNSIPGKQIQKIIDKIPTTLWQEDVSRIAKQFHGELQLPPLIEAFKALHGKQSFNTDQSFKERIIYEEFFRNQLKIMARRLKSKRLASPIIDVDEEKITQFLSFFPYQLTLDQKLVLKEIQNDLKSSHPMMRMIQGDVGCGKTSVAVIAALMVLSNEAQVAFMCPTEALAQQHYKTLQELLPDSISLSIILGSTKAKEKRDIAAQLENGSIKFIVGTHSLIQDSIVFKNLQLAIIDEQHKFGVEQRQKLAQKGQGVHTLIMTATPIPRSLQLAQYGDLDISTIRTMPEGRKAIQTRIVTDATYDKYLSFIKTRVELGEQVYIVVPAIEESETLNLKNVNEHELVYKKYFPELKISVLHGQLKSDQKQDVMKRFKAKEIDILISTTVIEVGINIINSTVISIYNPERFGMSSLHQLRGRVGRGDKAGFCFLITDKSTSPDAMQRLKIIEKTLDGFEISEADLKNRGQGDLFGNDQSGHSSPFKFANIFSHYQIYEKVTRDLNKLTETHPEILNNYLIDLIDDTKISSTI